LVPVERHVVELEWLPRSSRLTPLNNNPQTPAAVEMVARLRAVNLTLERRSPPEPRVSPMELSATMVASQPSSSASGQQRGHPKQKKFINFFKLSCFELLNLVLVKKIQGSAVQPDSNPH
jgi:hypothetical protein